MNVRLVESDRQKDFENNQNRNSKAVVEARTKPDRPRAFAFMVAYIVENMIAGQRDLRPAPAEFHIAEMNHRA